MGLCARWAMWGSRHHAAPHTYVALLHVGEAARERGDYSHFLQLGATWGQKKLLVVVLHTDTTANQINHRKALCTVQPFKF